MVIKVLGGYVVFRFWDCWGNWGGRIPGHLWVLGAEEDKGMAGGRGSATTNSRCSLGLRRTIWEVSYRSWCLLHDSDILGQAFF